jgi:hypothetical protein
MGLWITCRDCSAGHVGRGSSSTEQKTSSFNGLCTNGGDQVVDNLGVNVCKPHRPWLAEFCTLFDQRLRTLSQASTLYTSSPAQMNAKASSVLGAKCSPNSSTASSNTNVGATYCKKPNAV